MRVAVDVHTLVTAICAHMCVLDDGNKNDESSLRDDLLDPIE